MSSNKESHTARNLGTLASIATIVGVCIAVIALVPAFGQWLTPNAPSDITPSESSKRIIEIVPSMTATTPPATLSNEKPSSVSSTPAPTIPPATVNYFRNFKVISDTPGELVFSVDYNYDGDKGDIWYGVSCLDNGLDVPCVVIGGDNFSPHSGASNGTLVFHLGLYGPNPSKTDQVNVGMFTWGPSDLVAHQIFDYEKQWAVVLPTPTLVR